MVSPGLFCVLSKTIQSSQSKERSMVPRPRYHAQKRWAGERGIEIRVLAGALARLLDEENVHGEGFGAKPRTPYPRPGRPYFYGYPRREGYQPRPGPRARPRDPRPYALPRSGPPVAAIRVPRRYCRGRLEARRPRGSNPRGPLRGGPERSADDPQREPRGGQCGGPERSAKEPQTPNQSSRAKTDGEEPESGEKTSPTVVTVDKGGKERKWGPLSRATAWRAGSYWEEVDREVKTFLEKDGKMNEVSVEKLAGREGPRFWFRDEARTSATTRRKTGRPACRRRGGRRVHEGRRPRHGSSDPGMCEVDQ